LKSEGNPAKVLTLALTGAVRVCYDERVLAEYSEVLSRPRFKFDPQRVQDILTKLELNLDGLLFAPSRALLVYPIQTTSHFLPWRWRRLPIIW
jgi:hypothetical protein